MASQVAALVVVRIAFLYTRLRRDRSDSDEKENSVWVPRVVIDAER